MTELSLATANTGLSKLVLENLTCAVILLDASMCPIYLNQSAEDLLATSKQHARGQEFGFLLRDAEDLIAAFRSALATGIPFTHRQTSLNVISQHQVVLVDISATPVPNNCLLLEIQPMDRLMRISREEALVSSQQASRHLVRGLAHEIKNPLGGIRGAAQLLARELPQGKLEYTSIIIEEADRLRDLVDRMLGSHEPPTLVAVNVHEILERVTRLIDVESSGAILFRRDYDPSLPELHGDRGQLLQASLNVVRNAMQALLESATTKPRITLRTRVQRRFTIGKQLHKLVCRIDIEDNGPGIAADIQDTIFFPMISGRADGTGLGLAIAQSVVAQHHGMIECDSQPGRTQFSLYLPVETRLSTGLLK